MYTLEGVSSVANFISAYEETPSVYLQRLLCFQWQPFKTQRDCTYLVDFAESKFFPFSVNPFSKRETKQF